MFFFETKNSHQILANSNNICSVQLSVQNEPYSWLIDTGASISAVKYKHVLELNIPIHKKAFSVNGIGGSIRAIGSVCLQLTSGDFSVSHEFYVFNSLPCKDDGIIGNDFLTRFQSIINLNNNTLTIFDLNNTTVQLKIKTGRSSSNCFVLPPRAESIHYIETSLKDECVVCASEIQNGLYIANTIVKPIENRIPILVLNTTDQEIKLENIAPTLHNFSEYNVCTFNKVDKNAERVKELFSILNLKHLNKEERLSIESLCAKYSDIFCLSNDKITTTQLYKHTISLKDNTEPIFTKPYRLPYSQKSEVKKQIDSMLKDGIIEPARSEWSSPLLLVPKKTTDSTKKWRLVVDYRKLNNVIQDDKFPLPNISEVLDSLSGSIYFTHLDLYQGYYSVPLDVNSRKYTAFASGQYQMTRLPMGLKTSPSAFSRMMTIAMSGLNHEKCLLYLDDLVIFGRNLTEHNKNLLDVFSRLREVNLKLNPAKCDFLKKEILYLGHVVSGDGILPDPAKIEIVKSYPVPQNLDETRRFVAFANYYRRFIPQFAQITHPLNNLCRKNVPFIWDNNCQISFEKLKNIMSSPPVLQYPDFSENSQFTLHTDASSYALGAVLSNSNGKPVAYASRSLNKGEINYPTVEKELLAIVWAVKHFRPYLYGRTFKVLTDHRPLLYLFNMRDPSSRLIKFRLTLEEYDFSVEYIKGPDNSAADALSRLSMKDLKDMTERVIQVMTRAQYKKLSEEKTDCTLVDMVSSNKRPDQPCVVETHIKPKESVELRMIEPKEFIKLRNNNEILKENEVFSYVPGKRTIFINPASRLQWTRADFARELGKFCTSLNIEEIYLIKESNNERFIDKLITEVKNNKNWTSPRFCILSKIKRIENKDDKRCILNDFHLLPTSGHAGKRRMLNNIKKYYFWGGLENDISEFVKRCSQCQKQKHSTPIKEPMVITSTATTAFDKIYLDIVGPLDKDNYNYSYILTIQCELTKFVEAYPLITKSTTEVAKNFVNNFVLRHGIPKEIATDRGTEFISSTMKEVCILLHINKLNSTAYHHQSIGALENTHKHLGAFLRIQCNDRPETWSTWIPYWCFAYNTSVHSSTKFTPFELVYGKQCNLPSNLCKHVEPLYNSEHYPLELRYRLQLSQKEARNNLINSKIIRKGKFDEYINPIKYKENDLILIKNETGNKLNSLYLGPYKVIKDESPNVLINKDGKIDTIHKNRTKLFTPNV